MTIKLKVEPDEAHTALAHFAEMAAQVQANLAKEPTDHEAFIAMAGDVAAWHERGLFLLQYVLDTGSHSLDLRQCLTAPGVQERCEQFGSADLRPENRFAFFVGWSGAFGCVVAKFYHGLGATFFRRE